MISFQSLIHFLRKPRVEYEPLIEVRVFRDALLHNLHKYQSHHPKLQFAPVLKSNAYGHGLVQVGKILDAESIAFFIVDSFYEALTLRQHGVKSKIVVLGYERLPHLLNHPLKDCVPTIIDFETLRQVISALKKQTSFHLKIDTGMHRQGILAEDAGQVIKLIQANPNFVLEGLCTHFADADGNNKTFTEQQIKAWNETAALFKKEFPAIKHFHASNTAGTFYENEIVENVGRLGLGLYGINPSPFEQLNLQPALEMKSVISSIKKIGAGEKIGYGITYELKEPMTIATVPVGYNEGVDRRLSNSGCYMIGGVECPLVGRVSMNISTIDISKLPNTKIGDAVTVISSNSEDKNSAEQMAKLCGCIPYEILVHIPSYLRRVVV